MQAITVRPHWAFAMLALGKRIENRDFFPTAMIGQRIALHAGKHVGGSPSMPATMRGFRELACDMIGADYLAAPVWFKREEPFLAWQHLRECKAKSSHILRDDDCPKSVVFATARIETFEGKIPDGYAPPWAQGGKHWWHLAGFKALARPIPCDGKQGVWRLPDDVAAQVAEQMGGNT